MAAEWNVIVSSVLTAGAALGGVYLSSFLKQRDDRQARRELRDSEHMRLKREKGEHLYLGFDGMRATLQASLTRDIDLLEGRIDAKKYNEGAKALSDTLRDRVHTAKFTIESYFPDVLPQYLSWRAATTLTFFTHDSLIDKKRSGEDARDDEISEYKLQIRSTLDGLERICTLVAESCRD